ncbi:RNA polymerase subunit sigma-70, partial [Cellulomonas septica]|nr:RNA polymerase subunit sigma-70 [Cellulomonas septica]
LRTLYLALDAVAPSLGSRTALAAVVGRLDGPVAGLAALPPEPVPAFQPWWAARGDLLARAGRRDEAVDAFVRAADLSDDEAVRDYLERRAQSG